MSQCLNFGNVLFSPDMHDGSIAWLCDTHKSHTDRWSLGFGMHIASVSDRCWKKYIWGDGENICTLQPSHFFVEHPRDCIPS